MLFSINGTELTGYVKSYKVEYNKILGPNSYRAIDGTVYEDIITYKVKIDITFVPLMSVDLAAITGLCHNETVTVVFDDPKTNSTKNLTMIPTLSNQNILITHPAVRWGDVSLTLEEQ